MKFKIYEKNDLKKYLNKNEEFNEIDLPDNIKSSISNQVIPRKSFQFNNYQFNDLKEREKYSENLNSNPQNYSNLNFQTFSPKNFRGNFLKKNEVDNNENFLSSNGFNKFLQKKSIYDRLSELKESIGKRKINSPIVVLSGHENEKSDIYDKITNTEPDKYFVKTPKILKSLISLNCREFGNSCNYMFQSYKSNRNLGFSKKEKKQNNKSLDFFISSNKQSLNKDLIINLESSILNQTKDMNSTNITEQEIKSSASKAINSHISLRNFESTEDLLNLKFKSPSKVNILHKIEQYKDYFRFKGVN